MRGNGGERVCLFRGVLQEQQWGVIPGKGQEIGKVQLVLLARAKKEWEWEV